MLVLHVRPLLHEQKADVRDQYDGPQNSFQPFPISSDERYGLQAHRLVHVLHGTIFKYLRVEPVCDVLASQGAFRRHAFRGEVLPGDCAARGLRLPLRQRATYFDARHN